MQVMELVMPESDAVRAYVRGLRAERHYSQDAVADAIKMPRRTYIAWEGGTTTRDIKAPMLIRVIAFLGGAFEHLSDLGKMSEAEADKLAREWVRLTPAQEAQAARIRQKLEY